RTQHRQHVLLCLSRYGLCRCLVEARAGPECRDKKRVHISDEHAVGLPLSQPTEDDGLVGHVDPCDGLTAGPRYVPVEKRPLTVEDAHEALPVSDVPLDRVVRILGSLAAGDVWHEGTVRVLPYALALTVIAVARGNVSRELHP